MGYLLYKGISEIAFDKIILTKDQFKFFKRLLNGESIMLPVELANIFVDYGLAKSTRIDDNTYKVSITEIGKNYSEYLHKEEQLKLYSNIKEWISIAVSIIALIVSFIALTK